MSNALMPYTNTLHKIMTQLPLTVKGVNNIQLPLTVKGVNNIEAIKGV